MPNLHERKLDEDSKIRIQFLTGEASRHAVKILVVRYTGVYGYGSGGNGDANYMSAMALAGVAAFNPWGIIHDLSELAYEWGDQLSSVLATIPAASDPATTLLGSIFGAPSAASQPAVVVGPACEEAVRTLFLGVDSDQPLESIGYVFRDLPAAWTFVENQIA